MFTSRLRKTRGVIAITVEVTPDRHAEFTAEAKRRGMSLAAFARQSMIAEIDKQH